PMSLLFGILIAVGRLALDSELIALRSCGVSLLTLYRPVLALSALFTVVNTTLMVWALPWGNSSLQQLRLDILTQTVSQQVQPRVFYEEWEPYVVYVFEVPPGQSRWKGVFLAESVPSAENNQITMAEWGEVQVEERGERVVLQLFNAIRHKVNLNDPGRYEISRHRRLEMVLEDQFASAQRAKISVNKGVRELTIEELRELSEDPTASAEQRNLARVEVHKKFAIPAACLVFGLFALPLGFNNRRGGKASGFALSIGVILLYYVLLSNGEEAARYGRLPAWAGMWAPNAILATVGVFLLARRNRDKSLLLTGVDRWLRRQVWPVLLAFARLAHAPWRSRRRQAAEPPLAPRPPERDVPRRDQGSLAGLVFRLPRPRITFPSLLDRYVARQFGWVFLLVVFSGVSLYVIADLSETIDEILKNKVPRGLVFDYYKYMSLQIFYDIAPIVVLVATLITFSLLSRTSEVTACKALGLSLYRLSVPALVWALLVVVLAAFLQSEVLPASNERVAQLQDRIRGREAARTYRRADRQWLFGQGRYIYNYTHYDPARQSLQRLQVFDFDAEHQLRRRLVTDRATYIGHAWRFDNGWARSFAGVEVTDYLRFEQPKVVRYPETPDYFDSEIRPPEQMRFGELKDYVRELQESGQPVPELLVELYNKLAYPVASLVMALVALPFAFRLGRQGALYGVGISIVLGMAFLGVFAFFTTLGETGALPPIAAVWSPSAVFAILSAYLFLGVRS
ncbi:MAG TPA: LptF/LptG family permease, partial [Thermoanaerobaculia bacterium]|nr:LptF/LptG family permease [Thermoanaerobaculia bacterium]